MNRDRDDRNGGDGPDPVATGGPQRESSRASFETFFKLFKPGQGAYVRWGTAIGGGVLVLAGASFLHERLTLFANDTVRLIVPILFLVSTGCLIWWIVGRNKSAVDFMIATESEMKKVNWSSRREVIGATKVVIMTVLMMSAVLFIIDLMSIVVFSSIGLLKGVNIIGKMFGGSGT